MRSSSAVPVFGGQIVRGTGESGESVMVDARRLEEEGMPGYEAEALVQAAEMV